MDTTISPESSAVSKDNVQSIIGDNVVYESTLEVIRENPLYGVPKIENFCDTVYIKELIDAPENNNKFLIEFYCSSYDKSSDTLEMTNSVGDNYEMSKLVSFTRVLIKQKTATGKTIKHEFMNLSYLRCKKLDKGFVIKLFGEKPTN